MISEPIKVSKHITAEIDRLTAAHISYPGFGATKYQVPMTLLLTPASACQYAWRRDIHVVPTTADEAVCSKESSSSLAIVVRVEGYDYCPIQ